MPTAGHLVKSGDSIRTSNTPGLKWRRRRVPYCDAAARPIWLAPVPADMRKHPITRVLSYLIEMSGENRRSRNGG